MGRNPVPMPSFVPRGFGLQFTVVQSVIVAKEVTVRSPLKLEIIVPQVGVVITAK
jgi:hypothetical protein